MKLEAAQQMRTGDYVMQRGRREPQQIVKVLNDYYRAGPAYQLQGEGAYITSYRVCQPHSRDGKVWSDRLGWVSILNA